MGRSLAAVLVVASAAAASACGRIGYDERNDDDPDAASQPVDAPAVDAVDADVSDGLPACPSGSVEVCTGSTVCIEIDERGYDTWTNAVAACAAVGRRLCSQAEWDQACPCATGLNEMFQDGGGSMLEWEWTADESGGVAHKRGYAACGDQSTHAVSDPYDFRCCVDR